MICFFVRNLTVFLWSILSAADWIVLYYSVYDRISVYHMIHNSLLYWYNTLLCNLYWLLGNFRFFLPSPSNYSEFHTCTLYVTYWLHKLNSYNVMIQRDFCHKMCCYNHFCTLLSPAIVVINTIISLCIIGSQMYVLNKQMQLVHFVMAISCNFFLSIHIQPMLTKT